jgi:hypothetical protein
MPLMQIVQRMKKLFYDHFGLIFRKLPIGSCFEMCMQALSSSIFHDKVYIFHSVDALVQLYYIGMLQLRENLDLPDCLLLSLQVQQLVPIVLLDGYPFPGFLVDGLLDLSVGAFANLLPQLVILNFGAPRSRELIIEKHRAC